jgi:hypothetical protein
MKNIESLKERKGEGKKKERNKSKERKKETQFDHKTK